MKPSSDPIRRGNIPAAIAAELRGQIEHGRLEPGRQLPGHRERFSRRTWSSPPKTAVRRFGDLRTSVDSHSQLVDAIAQHDADGARGILAAMLSRNHEFVLGLYALAPGASGEAGST